MATEKPKAKPERQPDPAEAFRNLITEWERGFDTMANRIMGTEEFSRGMNQLQDLQLSMQKRFNEAMAEQLANFNMPSRDDILRLGESIRALDQRLAKVESQLAKQAKKKKKKSAAAPDPSRPPRTKLPPSARKEQANG